MYGRLDGFPLAADGMAAARTLGEALRNSNIVAVDASPLTRAQETARALAEPRGLEVRTDARLIEWGGLARWFGRPWAEAMTDPELLAVYADPAAKVNDDPLDEAAGRVTAWAEEAADRHPDGVVLGVSHEAPLVAAYLAGRGGDWSAFRMLNIPHLGGVRLIPGPPEIVDPEILVPSC